jgi:hypothetical protein
MCLVWGRILYRVCLCYYEDQELYMNELYWRICQHHFINSIQYSIQWIIQYSHKINIQSITHTFDYIFRFYETIFRPIFIVWRYTYCGGPGSSFGIATGYGLDGPGIESRWGARFSAPVQTGPGAHPSSCTGSFPGVESGRGVTLTPHHLLVPRSKNRVELYLYSP